MNRIYSLLISLFLLFSSISFSQEFPTRGEIYDYEVGDVFHKIEKYLVDFAGTGDDAVLVDSTIKIISILDKYYSDDSTSITYLINRHLHTFSLDYNGDILYEDYYESEYEDYFGNLEVVIEGDSIIQNDDFYNGREFVFSENEWVNGGGNEEHYNFAHYVVGCGVMVSYSRLFVWSNVNTFINDKRIVYYKKGEEEWGEEQTIVGLAEVKQEDQAIIFPNPAIDYIQILTKDNVNIQIFNSLGQLILSQKAKSANSTIDVSSFLTGVYVVHTINEDGAKIGKSKFIKK